MRDSVGRPDAPVFIDQEGGRVQRLRPPIAPNYPAGAALGALYRDDRDAGLRAAWLMARLHAFDLLRFGITADCLPVLDVPIEGASDVIGTRAYGKDPRPVTALGRAAAEGLMAGGVLPVMKHIPGHGRAVRRLAFRTADRRHARSRDLRRHDFAPFKALDRPADGHDRACRLQRRSTRSARRPPRQGHRRDHARRDRLRRAADQRRHLDEGAFWGFPDKAAAILAAGCDIVLHCNGVMRGNARHRLADRCRSRASRWQRAERALTYIDRRDAVSEADVRAEFAPYFDAVA